MKDEKGKGTYSTRKPLQIIPLIKAKLHVLSSSS